MRGIIRFVLNNKFAVWILTLIIAAAGIYSGLNMKMQTIPNITFPVVTISTTYPGAAPKDVAADVTKPIVEQVKNISGVQTVSSSSYQNASSIQIEYKFGKDMNKAEQQVKQALGNVHLPAQAQKPNVSRVSFNAFPIMSFSATDGNESFSQLTNTVKNTVVPDLKGVQGVSSVDVTGQQVKKVKLNLNKKKMAKYGLDANTVKQVIQGSVVSTPLGLIQFNKKEKSVVIDGNIKTLNELKNLRIPVTPKGSMQTPSGQGSFSQQQSQGSAGKGGFSRSQSGNPGTAQSPPQMNASAQSQAQTKLSTVKLSDIASLKVTSQSDSIARTNGKRSIGISIVKSADANTVDVANRIRSEVTHLEKNHSGLHIVTIMDQGKPIQQSVNTMLDKALLGALFAVIIILLFLRNLRSTVIAVVSIPMSLLIAVLILKQLGISLNIMTLGAMTVAIGRVVDDSIVVIENIFRRMSLSDEKLKGSHLIREATRQMFIPIMSSTIVTIAVFLPMALVGGSVGQLFAPFALTIVFALSASLIIAITIVPMLAHTFFRNGLKKVVPQEKGPGPVKRFYHNVLNTVLNHKIISFGIAIALLVGSLFLIPAIGVSFLPSQGQKYVVATYSSGPGETMKQAENVAQKASKYLQARKGVKTVEFSVGGGGPFSKGNANDALFYVKYNDQFKNLSQEKKTVIHHLQKTTNLGTWGTQSFGASAGSNTISMYVYGNSLTSVKPVVNTLENKVKADKKFTNVNSSLSKTYDQYTLVVNQKKLSEYGLTAAQISMKLSQLGQAPVLTTIKKDGKKLNVYLQGDKKTYYDINGLTDKKIQTPLGKEIPLSELVKVKKGKSPNTITRRDGRIYAEVSADLTGKDVKKATADLKSKVDHLKLPSSVDVQFGGVTQQVNQSFSKLGLAMLAAIAIVYVILVITFGGGLAPFAILFSLPFTAIGGLLALYVSGETLSVSALIGALMLIGIVVTNAIVLIDRVVRNEKQGMPTREALLEAGATRLRPILMTALATVGALAPLAFGLEGSTLISKGLGITVIGGLVSSTVLTLVIVPVVYEFLMKFRRRHPSEVDE